MRNQFKTLETPMDQCSSSIWMLGRDITKFWCASGIKKLAFFTPDGKKKTFRVIPFGPKNAPAFYTSMMKTFQEEWNADFNRSVVDPPNPVEISANIKCNRSSPIRTVYGSRIVIDDILLYGTNIF